MGATTSLASRQLSVTPGSTTETKVVVRNSGTLVDQFNIDIVGDTREWVAVEPKVMNLMPGQDGEVSIKFSPARDGSVPAGLVPFGIRVLSREEPARSSVEEGGIQVEPYTDLQVELAPKTSRCRSKAKHQVVVDNAGNYPVSVEVLTADPEEELHLSLDHNILTVAPGTSAFLKLRAKPYDRFLRGAERKHPFQVTVLAGETPPITAQGTVIQQQLLPKWLLPALIALIALAVVAATLWFTVLKPTVVSAAREAAVDAAQEENAALSEKAEKASEQAAAAEQKAAAAEQKAAAAVPGGGAAGPGPVTGPNGVDISKGSSVDFRVTTTSDPTPADDTFKTFSVNPVLPADKVLVITDVFLQNPRGDGGLIQIRRGDKILHESGLDNFRDLDLHTVGQWTFAPGESLVVAVDCDTVATPGGKCSPSVSFVGRLAG